ncbi:hypothetical protein HU200_030617 [Digitaria exilis]|uniref:Uncharacterized protein n=1 Tax=Digitaria exilis TaxID=1010633 RepID=A0A835BRJ0_9POAL|nr:hypothetical protein HU200_030617 [Digitaria exilis]
MPLLIHLPFRAQVVQ